MPFIKHGDFVLSESNAILKYFCEYYTSVPEHWYPKDPAKRAVVDKYLEWGQYHLRESMIWEVRIAIGLVKDVEVDETLRKHWAMV